jgi:hypothetical protein
MPTAKDKREAVRGQKRDRITERLEKRVAEQAARFRQLRYENAGDRARHPPAVQD